MEQRESMRPAPESDKNTTAIPHSSSGNNNIPQQQQTASKPSKPVPGHAQTPVSFLLLVEHASSSMIDQLLINGMNNKMILFVQKKDGESSHNEVEEENAGEEEEEEDDEEDEEDEDEVEKGLEPVAGRLEIRVVDRGASDRPSSASDQLVNGGLTVGPMPTRASSASPSLGVRPASAPAPHGPHAPHAPHVIRQQPPLPESVRGA